MNGRYQRVDIPSFNQEGLSITMLQLASMLAMAEMVCVHLYQCENGVRCSLRQQAAPAKNEMGV